MLAINIFQYVKIQFKKRNIILIDFESIKIIADKKMSFHKTCNLIKPKHTIIIINKFFFEK